MADNRMYLIAGGILLAGAGVGIAYYLSSKPKSEILGVAATRNADGTVTVRATVKNAGRTKGYFKIQALIAKSPPCSQGQTGYERENNWAAVLACVTQGNGSWAGTPAGGWVEIAPGQTAQLTAISVQPLPSGQYGLYVNAAVSTQASTETRLKDKEHYYWTSVNI